MKLTLQEIDKIIGPAIPGISETIGISSTGISNTYNALSTGDNFILENMSEMIRCLKCRDSPVWDRTGISMFA